ncbi:MAG: choice-of-anchor D domain-containing protein [bacterium]|nr:choice-of-anchor D domain-containing protein [bacterium]
MNNAIGRFLAILMLVWAVNLGAQTVELGGISNDSGNVMNFGIADGSNNEKVAQSFSGLTAMVNKVVVSVAKTGTPSDNVVIEIRQGSPDGTLLASGSVSGSSISSSPGPKYSIDLSSFAVFSNTTYYVVYSRSGASDPRNFFLAVRGSSGGVYGVSGFDSGGPMFLRSGVGWGGSDLRNAFVFSVFGSLVSLAQATPSPTSLSFGDVTVGQTAQRTLRIKNTGTAVLTINSVSSNNSMITFSPAIPPGVNVNTGDSTSAITVSFAPTVAGSASGNITINHNGANSPAVVAVTGNGIAVVSSGGGSAPPPVVVAGVSAPGVTLVPISLSMDSVSVGGPGSYKTLEIRNDSLTTLSVNNISVNGPNAGEFLVNMTSANIEAGGKRIVVVGFTPATAGSKTASIVIKHNATGGQSVVPLTGIAGPAVVSVSSASASVVPQSIGFDTTGVNSTTEREVTISNSGSASLVVGGISLGGVDPSHFSFSPSSLTVLAGSSRTVKVNFSPKSVGPKSAILVIANNSSNSVIQIPLAGTTPIYFAPPVANMSVDKKSGSAPFTVRFSNTNRGGLITRWGWNPGDGSGEKVSYSNGDSLTYTYLQPGLYHPILYVDGPGGGDTQHMAADSILVLAPQPLIASIHSDTDTLKMGTIDINNGSVESSFQIWNIGNDVFDGAISLDGDNSFTIISADSLKTVAPGSSDKRTVAVRFSPTSGGVKTARLFLKGNGNPASTTVVLVGEGRSQVFVPISPARGPILQVSTNRLDLGDVTVSRGKSTAQIVIKNNSNGDDTLTAKLFLSSNNAFSVSTDTLALASGELDSITVEFVPTESGVRTARLYFFHNAGSQPFIVNIVGEGHNFTVTIDMVDFDGSGAVDFPDFFLISEKINNSSSLSIAEVAIYDLNGDGKINNDDFFVFTDFFGKEVY